MNPCLRLLASVGGLLQAALCAEAVVVADSGSDDGSIETIRTRNALRTENAQGGLDAAFTYDALAMGSLGNEASWGSLAGDATETASLNGHSTSLHIAIPE